LSLLRLVKISLESKKKPGFGGRTSLVCPVGNEVFSVEYEMGTFMNPMKLVLVRSAITAKKILEERMFSG
jgi:hypothetical protein